MKSELLLITLVFLALEWFALLAFFFGFLANRLFGWTPPGVLNDD